MNCPDLAQWSAHLDEGDDPLYAEHLRQCPRCAAALDSLRSLTSALQASLDEAEQEFDPALWASWSKPWLEKPAPARAWMLWCLALGCLALLGLSLFLLPARVDLVLHPAICASMGSTLRLLTPLCHAMLLALKAASAMWPLALTYVVLTAALAAIFLSVKSTSKETVICSKG